MYTEYIQILIAKSHMEIIYMFFLSTGFDSIKIALKIFSDLRFDVLGRPQWFPPEITDTLHCHKDFTIPMQ